MSNGLTPPSSTASESSFCISVNLRTTAGEGAGLVIHARGDGAGLARHADAELFLDLGRSTYLPEEGPSPITERAARLGEHIRSRGLSALQDLDDHFLVALWEPGAGRLTLARDLAGRRALYYTVQGDRVTASDSLSLLVRSTIPQPQLSAHALDLFWALGFVPAPHCILCGVRKIPAGAATTISAAGAATISLLPFPEAPAQPADEPLDLQRQIMLGLERSLDRQATGSGPTCLMLSGGLDSALLAWLLARREGSRMVTVAIDTQADDSAERARQVAAQLGITHHSVPAAAFSLDRVDEVQAQLDEPLADTMLTALLELLRAVATFSDSCLSGIGADSLFCGLNTHVALDLWAEGRSLTPIARAALGAAAAETVQHMLNLLHSEADPMDAWAKMFAILTCEERALLARGRRSPGEIRVAVREFVREWLGAPRSFAERILRFDAEVPMADSTLQGVRQAASMARVAHAPPFLAGGLIELSRRTPRRMLVRDGVGKRILRELLSQRMPSALWELPKLGFRLPLARLLERHRGAVEDFLLSRPCAVVEYETARPWVREFYASPSTAPFGLARRLWLLVVLESWCRTHRLSF
jgi:asparagine synthase (glutamine-hydrolysing)